MPDKKIPRKHYKYWIYDALRALGGRGDLVQVNKQIWKQHQDEIKKSGDSFYNWQYEVRWAGSELRKEGMLKPEKEQVKRGTWELT